MRKLLSTLIVILVTFIYSSPALADGAGSNSGEVLRLGLGGYAPAMGNAFTAYAAGASSMQYNPAGLAFSARSETELMYQKMVEGISQGNMAVALPVGQTPTFGQGFGIDLKFIDYGRLKRTVLGTGGLGVTLNRRGTFGAQDMATGVGYGIRYSTLSIGAIGRYISLEIDDVKATGISTDVGVQWRHPSQYIRAGLVVKNLGSNVKFDEKEEQLPLAIRSGISTTLFDRFRANLDVEWVRNDDIYFNAGMEYVLFGFLPLRAGYDGRNETEEGYTFGTGFQYQALNIDYAYLPFGEFGNNHRFGIRFRF